MKDYLIVRTKITPPKLGKNILKRQRLLRLLRDNLDKKLILISADAGYGKTTLILDLAEEIERHRRAWYTVDKVDADFIVFMSYLVESISNVYPNFGNKTKIVIKSIKDLSTNVEMLVGTFINELIDTLKDELFVFIDDYHLIGELKPINDALNYLIEHQPQNLHLIISTRTLPTIQLTKLSAKQELFMLEKEDIQFTHEEVRTLFKDVYHIEIQEEKLNKIEEYARGWITGLQLVSQELSYKKPNEVIDAYSRISEKAFEYFSNEIMQKLSKSLQDFLLKSSILESMETELLDNLLGMNNSNELLNSLMKLNLFISVIRGEKDVFKYHPLFREFLLTKLSTSFDKELIKELHRRAGTYFTQTGAIGNGIQHWLASMDYEKAGMLIERIGRDTINKGMLDMVNNWIDSLLPDFVNAHPWLLAYKGEILYKWGGFDDAMQTLKKAKKLFSQKGDKFGTSYVLHIIGVITARRGNPDEGLKIERNAFKLVPQNEYTLKVEILNAISGILGRLSKYKELTQNLTKALALCKKIEDLSPRASVLHNLGTVYYLCGEFTRAEQKYREALKIYNKTTQFGAGITYNNMASLLLEKGDYSHCRVLLDMAIQICKEFNDRIALAYVYHTVGDMLSEIQKYDKAMENYQNSLKLIMELKEQHIKVSVLRSIAKLYLAQADSYHAEQYINEALKLAHVGGNNLQLARTLLIQAEINIAVGYPNKAKQALLNSLSIIKSIGAKYDLMQAYFYLCQLYLKKINSAEELKLKQYMRLTLKLASTYGYDQFLIKKCRRNPEFLTTAVREQIYPRYAIFILSRIGSPTFDSLSLLLKLKDESIQRWVIEALVNIRDDRVLPLLEKISKKVHPSLKPDVLKAITSMSVVERTPREAGYDIKVSFFGGLEVCNGQDEKLLIKWKSSKVKSLFAYLIMNKYKPIHKDKLIDLFWQGVSVRRAESSLWVALSNIRHNIKPKMRICPLVEYANYCYQINPKYCIWTDVDKFDNLLKESTELERIGEVTTAMDKLAQAVNLYKGSYLSDIYDDWVEEKRRWYEEKYRNSLKRLATYQGSFNNWVDSKNLLEKVLVLDEFDEDVYRSLMRCYAKLGNRKAIEHLYKRLKKTLSKELKTAPEPETTILYQKLIKP
ncbi:MAG: BTAD domain-containing putative transcriptional regulator [bacterium]|nr:BTAD domain-containing putative transcriptional regulator [bacterium]